MDQRTNPHRFWWRRAGTRLTGALSLFRNQQGDTHEYRRISTSHIMTQRDIAKGAMLSGVINALINGAIQYFMLRGEGPIPLSVDTISEGTPTVLASAVPLAVSLAMILTAVTHWTLKVSKKPFMPTTLWLIIKHGFFALASWSRALSCGSAWPELST